MKTLNVMVRPKWAIFKGGYWLNAIDLGLSGQWADKWDSYNEVLKIVGIKLSNEKDTLVLSENKKNGVLTAKLAYEFMIKKLVIWRHPGGPKVCGNGTSQPN